MCTVFDFPLTAFWHNITQRKNLILQGILRYISMSYRDRSVIAVIGFQETLAKQG